MAGGNIKWFNICRNYFHISSIHGIDAAAAVAGRKREERERERGLLLGLVAACGMQRTQFKRDGEREREGARTNSLNMPQHLSSSAAHCETL